VTTSLRSMSLTLLAATALLLPASPASPTAAAVGDGPDTVLTVGVDVPAGWLWVAGSPEGCSVSQAHDDGFSGTFTSADEPLLVEARPGGVLELTGCGTAAPVTSLPRTTSRRKVVGDGAWLVGPHFTRGGVYVGTPTQDTFGYEQGTATCSWEAHRSFAAYDDHVGFPDREGRLVITRRTKVVETDDDCVWKRIH
jgi:hypothetical protein